MNSWRDQHREVEQQFLRFIGTDAPLVLKGGTALMLCYGLNRFSEDLDFDARHLGASTIRLAQRFATTFGYECAVKKDTATVQRVTVHYGGLKPLKIETSSRTKAIRPENITVVNEITVYTLAALATMKINAYQSRDRIRDLFDVTFIIRHYWSELPVQVQDQIQYALSEKGLEQFDAVLAADKDELIDPDILAENFLEAYATVGLLSSN